jgi:hypothetical protein
MATTTNRYLAYPAAAAGVSRTSSGSAWGSGSAWTELVPANTITSTFYIAGLTWMWWTPAAAADTTYEIVLGLGIGAAGSEVEKIQIPASMRGDSLAGYMPSNIVILPEPFEVAANTRVAVKLYYGVAASVTVTAIKILYQIA